MTEVEKKAVEKKVVSRNVVIALGIIVIILLVGLVGAIAYYTSIISGKDSTIADKDNTISSLNSQISSLNSEKSNLTDIVNLANSTVWVNHQTFSQPASSYSHWTFGATYAGYISISATDSPTGAPIIFIHFNVYVQVIYSAYGVNYNNTISVGTGGTAVFPILPCSNIEIGVGNNNTNLSGLNFTYAETVTITYYY
jgi:predicted PurR-regulated permease PerM